MSSRRFKRALPLLLLGLLVPVLLIAFVSERSAVQVPEVEPSVSSFQFMPAHRSIVGADTVDGGGEEPWMRQVTPEEARKRCQTCHEVSAEGFVKDPANPLNHRLEIPREQWAAEINLSGKCGTCHQVVEPQAVPTDRWMDVLEHMLYIFKVRGWPINYTSPEWMDLLHYYVSGSAQFEDLPPDPPVSGVPFVTSPISVMRDTATPKITNVNVVDLDRDGEADVLACDVDRNAVMWYRRSDTGWVERRIGGAIAPAKTEVFDFNGDNRLDIVLPYLGSLLPTDEKTGGALLFLNKGDETFTSYQLIGEMGRPSDIRPADFDNDGDIDFIMSSYGFLTVGEIGWLEQKPHPSGHRDSLLFEYHRLSPKAGGIHVIPTDLNGDTLMDAVALIAQEHEEIIGFVNQGGGQFKQHLLYKAFSPAFGSSGIELADMDRDGDLDILYTNGDAVDLPAPMILPYHGVQWLENTGNLEYSYHSLFNFYGAYRALPGDLDNDGDLDIVAVTMLSNFEDTTRMSVVWLENDGKQNFTPRGIGNTPINLITLDVADVDGDGDLDLVTGGMNLFMRLEGRMGRVTLWENVGPYGNKGGKKKNDQKKGKKGKKK